MSVGNWYRGVFAGGGLSAASRGFEHLHRGSFVAPFAGATAATAATFTFNPSGGVDPGGLSAVSKRAVFAPSGGVDPGGEASSSPTSAPSGSPSAGYWRRGRFVGGFPTVATRGFDHPRRGRFSAPFGATSTAPSTLSASGGVIFGAALSVSMIAAPVVSGGVRLGSAATGPVYARIWQVGIGPIFGASLSISLISTPIAHTFTPAGGIEFGGAAPIVGKVHAYTFTPSGGTELSGPVASVLSAAFNPAGGVEFGGAASIVGQAYAYTFTTSGGWFASGRVTPVLDFAWAGVGGLGIGGFVVGGPRRFLVAPSGGVRTGGAIFDPVAARTIHEAVLARLRATVGLTDLVGARIFYKSLPQTAVYPAVTYFLPSRTYGHALDGSDGSSVARVQVSAWSTSIAEADAVARSVRERFDGFRGWIGRVEVLGCIGGFDVELSEPPKVGSDSWTYQIAVDYLTSHRVPRPSLLDR